MNFKSKLIALLLGASQLAAFGMLVAAAAASSSVRYVDTGGSDTTNDCTVLASPCLTIAHAVSEADPGDIIEVAAGSYAENDTSISIEKSLTIRGPNAGISPNTGTRVPEAVITSLGHASSHYGFDVAFAIWGGDTSNVTFEGLTFDTSSELMRDDSQDTITLRQNIFMATGGSLDGSFFYDPIWTLDDNLFTDIAQAGAETFQIGGSAAKSADVTITDNVWDTITGNGALNLTNATGTISGNTFTDVEYYGILVAYESGDLDITNNTFDGITNPAPLTSATWGAGIRFYEAGSTTGPVNITNNDFRNSYLGVSVRAGSDITLATIGVNNNSIAGNTTGVLNSGSGTLDASGNWWGANSGPSGAGFGAGDSISSNVDYEPWCFNSGCTLFATGGTDDDDVLYGTNGNDIIFGFDGNDVTYGYEGSDTLYGNAGNDVQYGGKGSDTLYGNAGNDVQYGGKGSDTLYGNAGNDYLKGGAGNDSCSGGAGRDSVVSC